MQEPVNPWFIPDDEGENGITQIVDTHNQMYLEGPAPDISVVTLNYVLNIYSVDCVGDIKPRKNVTLFLTDCHEVMFIRIYKTDNTTTGLSYMVDYTNCLHLKQPNGEVKEYPNQLVKIIRETHILQNEIKIMNILKGTPNIIQLEKHSTTCLLLYPRCFKSIHEKGVLHRDCHPSNILYYIDESNELKFILSDFGYSILSNDQPAIYKEFRPQDDLHILIHNIYLLMNKTKHDTVNLYNLIDIKTFWASKISNEPWDNILKLAEECHKNTNNGTIVFNVWI
ncbi:15085_t:CDS:2 [Entrophospora sp. SA101]|nr:15085_t:CDS:2 [Entrophospora sp. SA101]